jgi:hypothetical protein
VVNESPFNLKESWPEFLRGEALLIREIAHDITCFFWT